MNGSEWMVIKQGPLHVDKYLLYAPLFFLTDIFLGKVLEHNYVIRWIFSLELKTEIPLRIGIICQISTQAENTEWHGLLVGNFWIYYNLVV